MRSIHISFLLGILLVVGCSSKGEAGPAGPSGPSGPRGDQGLQGTPGQPGESVLSAQLSVGSLDCPNGGSQFSSVSGTTFACNGAEGAPGAPGVPGLQGIQGVPGATGPTGPPGPATPRLVVKTATGAVIGPMVGYTQSPGSPSYLAVFIDSLGLMTELNQGTGAARICAVYFEGANCTGAAFADWQASASPISVCDAAGQFFRVTSFQLTGFAYQSWRDTNGCNNATVAASASGYPAQNAATGSPAYPYAAPLQVAYE